MYTNYEMSLSDVMCLVSKDVIKKLQIVQNNETFLDELKLWNMSSKN